MFPPCEMCKQTGWPLGWDVLEGTNTSDGSWGTRSQYFIDPFIDPFSKYSLRAYRGPGDGLCSGASVRCYSSLFIELTVQAWRV